jgi:hypothetical protein
LQAQTSDFLEESTVRIGRKVIGVAFPKLSSPSAAMRGAMRALSTKTIDKNSLFH